MPLGRISDVLYGSSNPLACFVPAVRGGACHRDSRRRITPPFVNGQQVCYNKSALFGRYYNRCFYFVGVVYREGSKCAKGAILAFQVLLGLGFRG